MFKKIALAVALTAATGAQAAQTVNYGWEDGGTVLSQFGSGMTYSNTSLLTNSGSGALLIEDVDSSTSGTPQGYVAWIQNLVDGDSVTAGFWAYDDSFGTSPSVRIWGHYTDDNNDVDSYAGSASGNSTYSGSAAVWEELTHNWVFDSNGGSRNGLMVEVRFYDGSSAPTGAAVIDDLRVEVSNDAATIITPAPVPVPAAVWLFASAAAGLAAFRRRRAA